VGIRFALAGMTWETIDVNEKSKVIFVKRVPGISVVDWDVEGIIDIHTVVLQKMRHVLENDTMYPYLSDRCRERLAEIRYICHNSGILTNLVTQISGADEDELRIPIRDPETDRSRFAKQANRREGNVEGIENGIRKKTEVVRKFAIFPWVGTRQIFTLHYALLGRGIKSKLPWITAPYLEIQFKGTTKQLESIVLDVLASNVNMYDLPLPDNAQVKGKYNEFVPFKLLRKQYIEDYLDWEGLLDNFNNRTCANGAAAFADSEA
jgi:ATP-dependent Lhr-like helicase